MIRELWYVVLYAYEIKSGKLTAVTRFGEKLVFFRDVKSGDVGSLADQCTHRGASLSKGTQEGTCVRCPFHGLAFDTTGKCQLIPANGKINEVPERYNIHAYPVREAYGLIWLYWGDRRENLPPLPYFENLDDPKLVFGRMIDPWRCHYSRCIENQLDVVHLPFVHRTTIGRGNKTVVNGPQIRILPVSSGEEMRIYVHNTKDEGQKPLRDEEMPEPSMMRQHLAFRFPHLWQNYIFDAMRIVIAFVPVDDHHTLLYMMTAHKITRLPILKQIVTFVLNINSLIIAHQDRRIVETQIPDTTSLHMSEKLVAGDSPVIRFRMERDRLKQDNQKLF